MTKMEITAAQYVAVYDEVKGIRAAIEGQEMFVPLDPANGHYAEIMRQVEAGTLTITEADS